MGHDLNIDELKTSTNDMTSDEKDAVIDNLREMIGDSKAQWDKLAAILQAAGDDVDRVFAAARTAMAGIGGDASAADLKIAREAFPAFDDLYKHLDAACLYEMERFNRHCDELAAMSIDRFIDFKNESARNVIGKLHGPRRWWRVEDTKVSPIVKFMKVLVPFVPSKWRK